MLASLKGLVLIGLMATPLFAAAINMKKRDYDPSNFKLFVYGDEEVGGETVFYADGLAYVGNISTFTGANEITGVNCGVFTATPNSNVSWTSKTFYLSNNTGEVGFANSESIPSDAVTSGFKFMDSSVLVSVGNKLHSTWNRKAASNGSAWKLLWNVQDAPSAVLRDIPPANVLPEDVTDEE